MNAVEIIPQAVATKEIVSVADMVLSNDPSTTIVTHALGSCLGVAVHDPNVGVGGMLHAMMPSASINPARAAEAPFTFVDTGIPLFFERLEKAGVDRQACIVTVCGGAKISRGSTDRFSIGKRNYIMLRKILWQSGILINAEDVGGTEARTMYLNIGTGEVRLKKAGHEYSL